MSEIKPCPFVVAGPWREDEEAEDGGDLWRAEIQVVGGHALVAAVYGGSPDEAQGRAELAIEAWTTRASDACASVQKERDEAVAEIRALYRAYVNTLESARDRIIFLGGDCDPLERMEEGDPHLIRARAFLARYEGGR